MMISKSKLKRIHIQRHADVEKTLAEAKRQLKEDQLLVIQAASSGLWLDAELVEAYNYRVQRIEALADELLRLDKKLSEQPEEQ